MTCPVLLPDILFHATYEPRLKSIQEHGLGATDLKNWDDSKFGVVYLAVSSDVARSYAETSDMVPEDWLDTIVVLRINTALIDRDRLAIDGNVLDNDGDTLQYEGVIPWAAIECQGQHPERMRA